MSGPSHSHDAPPPAEGACGPDEARAARHHERRVWWVAAVNLAAMAAQVAGGLVLVSAAILAEGVHMGAHVGAVLLAGLGYRVAAGRRAQGDAPGARRVEDLAAALNAAFLFVLAALILVESVQRLQRPQPIALAPALALAGFGLVVNVASILLLHHRAAGDETHGRDLNFRALYLHMLGDAGVGVMAIAGLLAVAGLHWVWADAAAGFAGAVLVAAMGVRVLAPLWAARRPTLMDDPLAQAVAGSEARSP